MNQITIDCECGTHMLKVQAEDGEFYLAMFHYGSGKRSFLQRLRLAIQVLFKGNPYADQLVIKNEEAKKLIAFIETNTSLVSERMEQNIDYLVRLTAEARKKKANE